MLFNLFYVHAFYSYSNGNASIVINTTQDSDSYPTYPLNFSINISYLDNLGAAISDVSGGSCFVNYSGTEFPTTYMTSSQVYSFNKTYTNRSVDEAFTVRCVKTASASANISLASVAILFYTVYDPYWIDLQLDNTTYTDDPNPLVATDLNYTVYAKLRNLSGLSNATLTASSCSLQVNSTANSSLVANITSGLYSGQLAFGTPGLYNLTANCSVNGVGYTSIDVNQSVVQYEPTFTYGNTSFGTDANAIRASLFATEGNNILLLQTQSSSGNALIIYNATGTLSQFFRSNLSFSRAPLLGFDLLKAGLYSFFYTDSVMGGGFYKIVRNAVNYTISSVASSFTQIGSLSATILSLNNTGDYSILWQGQNASPSANYRAILSRNVGGQFVDSLPFSGAYDGPLCTYDIDQDGVTDVFQSGYNGSSIVSRLYTYNGSTDSFATYGDLTPSFMNGACVFTKLFSTSDTDLFVYGKTSFQGDGVVALGTTNYSFISNFTTLTPRSDIALPGFVAPIRSDVIIADFSNTGRRDIVTCGEIQSSPGINVTYFYMNYLSVNGSFKRIFPFPQTFNISQCSLSAADYDNDGDLDLMISGVGENATHPIKLLKNNIAQIRKAYPPLPPSQINVSYNNITQQLRINWSTGYDNLTPSDMLSYNIEVRKLSDNSVVVSAINPVSTNPAQGYYGNAGFRQWYVLNNLSDPNVQVKVQTISANLMRSSFATSQYSSCSPPASGTWNISSQDCALTNSTYGPNLAIYVSAGRTLTIATNISLQQNTTLSVDNGTLLLSNGGNIDLGTSTLVVSNSSSVNSTQGAIRNGSLNSYLFQLANISLINVTLFAQSPLQILDANLSQAVLIANSSVSAINVSLGTASVIGSNIISQSNKLTLQFIDQFGTSISNVTVNNGTGNSTYTTAGLNLLYRTISAQNTTITQNLTFSKDRYYSFAKNYTLSQSILDALVINRTPEPIVDGFTIYTNTTGLITGAPAADNATLSNITSFAVGTDTGEVIFSGNLNLSFVNLSAIVNISQNNITINTTNNPSLNTTLVLTISNLTYSTKPAIFRDGSTCLDCVVQSYAAGNVTFSSPHASSYSTAPNAQISLTSTAKIMQNISSNFTVQYLNSSNTSQAISGTCLLTTYSTNLSNTNVVSTAMFTDGQNFWLPFNFTGTDIFNVSVSCTGAAGVEPVAQNFTITVLPYGIYFLLEKSFTGVSSSSVVGYDDENNKPVVIFTGKRDTSTAYSGKVTNLHESAFGLDLESSSMAIGDLNNDGFPDLVYMGTFAANGSQELGVLYNLTNKIALGQLTDGSLGIADFFHQGSSDIVACGKDAQSQARTLFFTPAKGINSSWIQQSIQFSQSQRQLDNFSDCRIFVYDINNDTYDDLIITGRVNGTLVQSELWINNGTSFLLNTTFAGFFNAEGVLIPGKTSNLIISGLDYNNSVQMFLFNISNQFFITNASHSANIVPVINPIASFGDTDFSGNYHIFISGFNQSGNTFANYLQYDGVSLSNDNGYLGSPARKGSALFADILGNSNLDLWVSGVDDNANPITQLYRNTAYLVKTPPVLTPPTSLIGSYSGTTLSLSWMPQANRTYNLRVGNYSNPNAFVSGFFGSSSNPTQGQLGNMEYAASVNYTMPNACFFVQVQSIDGSYRKSNWSAVTVVNNQTEMCDGFDNNCDGQIDESFRAASAGLFRYNGTVNGTPFTCSFYEQYAPQLLACNPNSVTSSAPGDSCGNGGTFAWNSTTHACDCANQTVTQPVQVGRSSGGGSSNIIPSKAPAATDNTAPTAPTAPPDTTQPTAPTQAPQQQSAAPSSGGGQTASKISRDLLVEYRNGRTYVTENIRNTQRTVVTAMTVRKSFPKSILTRASDLDSLTQFSIFSDDPIIDFQLGKMGYLESRQIVYSIPGHFTEDEIAQVPSQITTQQELTSAQIAQIEQDQKKKAAEALTVNVTEKVIGNQTQFTINVNLTANASSVQGVEIEQYIPKCLIREINETVLAAGIDPQLLPLVHIKQADPTIVWNLKQIDQLTQLTLRLNTLRSSDCNDTIKIQTLAQEYIQTKYEVNAKNLWESFSLTAFIVLFYLATFIVSTKLRKEHEDEEVNGVIAAALKLLHKGRSPDSVERLLIREQGFSESSVKSALRHIEENNLHRRHPVWHAMLEHSLIIFLFLIVFVIDILDFMNLLTGYLNWIQMVMAWIVSLIMFYEIDLTKLLFNNSKKWINLSLITGLFCMYLKVLVSYAQSQPFSTNQNYFIFDLYVFIIRHAHFFNITLFIIGFLLVIGTAFAMSWTTPVKKGCLYHLFTRHPVPQNNWQRTKRALKLSAIYTLFGYSVFNRVIEWLGVSIDNVIFVIMLLIVLFVLASTTFVHRHKPFKLRAMELTVLAVTKNSSWLLFLGIGLFAFIQPFLAPIYVQAGFAILISILLVVALYTITTSLSDHFEGLANVMGEVENVTTDFVKLFSNPSTIFLGVSGILLLQHIADLAIFIVPNITGATNSAYSVSSSGTLLGLFTDKSLIATHLFTLGTMDKFLYGAAYAISILGGIFIFLVPIVLWALYFMRRTRSMGDADSNGSNQGGQFTGSEASVLRVLHPSKISVKDLFFEKAGAFRNICAAILVLAVPSIITLLLTKVLSITYVTGITQKIDVGVVINAQQMTLSSDQVSLILIGFAAYVLIAISLYREALRRDSVKSQLVSITLAVSLTSLVIVYFVPYVQSIIGYLGVLWHTLYDVSGAIGASWDTIVVVIIVMVLLVVDLLLIYAAGLLILIFFGLPRTVKQRVVEALSHIPFFHRLFFLASTLSRAEQFVIDPLPIGHVPAYQGRASQQISAQQQVMSRGRASAVLAGTLLTKVEEFILIAQEDGHHLETILFQLKMHGYPSKIIDLALRELLADKRFMTDVEQMSAEHISIHRVNSLVKIMQMQGMRVDKLDSVKKLDSMKSAHNESKINESQIIPQNIIAPDVAQRMYLQFIDRYTYPEIKLALRFIAQDYFGKISIARVKELEEEQIGNLITRVQNHYSRKPQHSLQAIAIELTREGFDPELLVKILDHPLFDKKKAGAAILSIKNDLYSLLGQSNDGKMNSKLREMLILQILEKEYPYQLLVVGIAQVKAELAGVERSSGIRKRVVQTTRAASNAQQINTPDQNSDSASMQLRALITFEGVLRWVITAVQHMSKEEIIKALEIRSWRIELAKALIDYAILADQSMHHLDQYFERSYLTYEH